MGYQCFSYASDYPHEVDLVAAKQMIHETVERTDLTHAQKARVLGENAKQFFPPLKMSVQGVKKFKPSKSKAASYIFSFYARAGISHSNRINFVTFAEGTACLNGI